MQLFEHQERFVQIARDRPRYAWFAEPGVGKSIGTLAAIADAKRRGFTGATLILCPKSIIHSAWMQDAKHFPQLRCVAVWASTPHQRRELIRMSWCNVCGRTNRECSHDYCGGIGLTGPDVFVTNYETFKRHAEDFKPWVRRLVIDESSKVKAFDTQISRACHKFSDDMASVYLLSGTPAPNNATEYWSQVRCINASLFGPSFWRFAYRYFSPIKRTIGDRERIIGWKPLREMQTEFMAKLQLVSWSLRKSECLDLPEQTDVVREVELSSRELTAYTSMLNELRVDLGDQPVLTASMQARVMKLRQITSGLIYDSGQCVDIGTSKLDELSELLDEIGDRKVVVWAEFTAEIDRICKLLATRAATGRIDGQIGLDERTESIAAFQTGSLRYLVCHPAAAGHGITLTAASHAVYFSHGFSFETYQQSRDRLHRAGQRNPVTYYHLIAKGSVDERVMRALAGKRSGHEAIMELLGARQVA
jgi:SNF2 family DNA or RNA helicase